MAYYQNSAVTDSRIEVGNYAMYVIATAGSSAGAAGWVNLGAGMLKSFAYTAEGFTSQAGNAVDPIEGIASEMVSLDLDLIEYDSSSFSLLSGGVITATSATGSTTITVGGQVSVQTPRGFKLVNTRTLATGSVQTTTYVFNKAYMDGGYTMTPKSDNDTDPVNVYTFKLVCKQYATALTIFTKTVA